VKVQQLNRSGHYNHFSKIYGHFVEQEKKSTNLEMLAKNTVIILYQNHGEMYQI
jgi:hypothetical protein